jgi:signal transduction histidine kinase
MMLAKLLAGAQAESTIPAAVVDRGPQSRVWQRRAHAAALSAGAVLGLALLAAAVAIGDPRQGEASGWPIALAAGASVVLAGLALWAAAELGGMARGVDAVRQRVLVRAAGHSAPPLGDALDELAALTATLDGFVDALAARANELEVERRSIFHQEKMAAVGAMAAGVLHDIGNPIAAIDGVARAMLEAHASGDCKMGEGLCDPSLILRETARLQGITRMIAGLAAPPATAPQWLSVNEIVQTAMLLLHFDTRLAGVRIDTALDPQLPAVVGVSDALLQLVMNLMTNAADALRAAGRAAPLIQVKTSPGSDGVEITIVDNGCGMSDDIAQHAFEPLFTTKPSGRGTGLGLPLCRTIARQHGGDITLQSSLGVGTRVLVHLAAMPLALQAAVAA